MAFFKMPKQKDRSCVGFIYSENKKDLCIRVIDSESDSVYVLWQAEQPWDPGMSMFEYHARKERFLNIIQSKDIKKFIKNISKIFVCSLKAVILQIFELTNVPGYDQNADLCNDFIAAFESMGVPYCFLSRDQERFSTMIAAGTKDTEIEPSEKLFTIGIYGDTIALHVLQFTPSGYFMCGVEAEMDATHTMMERLDLIVKNHKPKHIILCKRNHKGSAELFEDFKNKLATNENLILLKENYQGYLRQFMEEMGKWVLDNSCCKYYVQPFLKYQVLDSFDKVLISVEEKAALPLTKSIVVSKDVTFVKEIRQDSSYSKLLKNTVPKHHKLDTTFDKHKITITVDANYIYEFKIQPLTKSDSLLLKLNENYAKPKIPIIAFWDNCFVICVHNDEANEYQCVEIWNGKNGTEIVIDFTEEKLICCQQKNLNEKNTTDYMVYDLIKIMSMPANEIIAEKSWKFAITKDDDHPVLLDFNTAEGMKLATPAFLMAILIKEHRKVIRKETGGEKPAQLGFCILDERYSPEEKERIKTGLKESCELLKIGFEYIET